MRYNSVYQINKIYLFIYLFSVLHIEFQKQFCRKILSFCKEISIIRVCIDADIVERERERERHTERETERHTERQTHRERDTERQTHRERDRERHTERQTHRQTHRQTDRQKIISKM